VPHSAASDGSKQLEAPRNHRTCSHPGSLRVRPRTGKGERAAQLLSALGWGEARFRRPKERARSSARTLRPSLTGPPHRFADAALPTARVLRARLGLRVGSPARLVRPDAALGQPHREGAVPLLPEHISKLAKLPTHGAHDVRDREILPLGFAAAFAS
jgi:hypothetical protein